MKRWMKRAAAFLLAVMMVAGLPGMSRMASANPPDIYAEMEDYASYYDFLAGTSGYLRAHRFDSDPAYACTLGIDGGFFSDWIGYRILDFDQDGQVELLMVGHDVDQFTGNPTGIILYMYEYNGAWVEYRTETRLTPGKGFTSMMRPADGGEGYQPIVDIFAYTANGQTYICAEYETVAGPGADGRSMGFEVYTYKNDNFNFVTSRDYEGSDGTLSTDYMGGLQQVGIVNANWNDLFSQYALIGHFAPNYESIVRITQNSVMKSSDLNSWLQYGTGNARYSRVDFSMPWQRTQAPCPNIDMLRMMLAGFSTWGGDYFTKEPYFWHEGEILAWAYNVILQDILNVESNYEFREQAVDLSEYLFSYANVGDGWFTFPQSDLAHLIKSMLSTCPTQIENQNWNYSEDFYASNGTVHIRVGAGIGMVPDLHLLIDSCYVENGYKFVSGNIYKATGAYWYDYGTYECIGRFTAGIDDTVFSIFGSWLLSLDITAKPVYAEGLVASASSYLPDQDDFTYGPELVLDGRTDTAWNEGAAGDGLWEWIQIDVPGGSPIPVTGIQILSGYHKSQAVFDANGKAREYAVSANGKPWFTWSVWYDNVVGWGYVADITSLRFAISDVLTGTLYDDTCVTEIRLLTANPISQTPPYGTGSTSSSVAPSLPANADYDPSFYILPESNSRLYTAAELAGLDKATLRLARNEIYARHGRRFNSADLQAYFDGMPWYHGTIAPADFDNGVLNSFELGNIKLIESLE